MTQFDQIALRASPKYVVKHGMFVGSRSLKATELNDTIYKFPNFQKKKNKLNIVSMLLLLKIYKKT